MVNEVRVSHMNEVLVRPQRWSLGGWVLTRVDRRRFGAFTAFEIWCGEGRGWMPTEEVGRQDPVTFPYMSDEMLKLVELLRAMEALR
jgi:hypothetical protein